MHPHVQKVSFCRNWEIKSSWLISHKFEKFGNFLFYPYTLIFFYNSPLLKVFNFTHEMFQFLASSIRFKVPPLKIRKMFVWVARLRLLFVSLKPHFLSFFPLFYRKATVVFYCMLLRSLPFHFKMFVYSLTLQYTCFSLYS